jgi:hypothetical protein
VELAGPDSARFVKSNSIERIFCGNPFVKESLNALACDSLHPLKRIVLDNVDVDYPRLLGILSLESFNALK